MANQLFGQALRFVDEAKQADPLNRDKQVARAKNALSSAYANSTEAEQRQLRELQAELDSLH